MKTIKTLLNQNNSSKQGVSSLDLEKSMNYLLNESIEFTGTVDFINSDLKLYKEFSSEEKAIDSGLQLGDVFLLNGVETVVTKIKQVIKIKKNSQQIIGFLIDMKDVSMNTFIVEQFINKGVTALTMISIHNGLLEGLEVSSYPNFSTLSTFKSGYGYIIKSSNIEFNIIVYGKPLDDNFLPPLTSGLNVISWLRDTRLLSEIPDIFGVDNVNLETVTGTVNGVASLDIDYLVKGLGYIFRVTNSQSGQGDYKLEYSGNTKSDHSYINEASAITSGIKVGDLWYDSTYKVYRTRLV